MNEKLLEKARLIAQTLVVILVVCVLGLLAVNQFLEYRYKSEFLQMPCNLCFKFNPNVKEFIENCQGQEIINQVDKQYDPINFSKIVSESGSW